jgi:hypothetical protein
MSDVVTSEYNWDGKAGKGKLSATKLFGILVPNNICSTRFSLDSYIKEIKNEIRKAHQRAYQLKKNENLKI